MTRWRPADLTTGMAMIVVLIAGLLVYPLRAQEASRIALTATLVENGSLVIDGYPLGIDRAVRDGRTYSDKAPGQPTLAVPFYALTQAFDLPPAEEEMIDRNPTLWLVTFGSVTLAGAALVMVGRRMALPEGRSAAAWSAAAIVTGTVLLPLSTVMFGHVVAGLLLAAAYLALMRGLPRPWVAGLLAGSSVLVEYTAGIGVVTLAAWFAWRHTRRIGWFLAGGMPAAGALGIYNALAFGSPFAFSYQYSAFHRIPEAAKPLLGLFHVPAIENLVLLFLSGRGIIVATPVIVAGIAGTLWMVRDRELRDSGWVCLAMFLGFLLLPIFWSNPFGGDSPGARYMAPGLIFLAPGLARFWKRRRILAIGSWAISAVTMVIATFTDALILTRNDPAGLSGWLPLAFRGDWMPNILGTVVGSWGDAAFLVAASLTLALFGWAMVRAYPPDGMADGGSLR